MVQVAVAQYAPGQDKVTNLATAEWAVADAAARGARVVVLPEYAMFTAPRMDQRFVAAAEPLDGPFGRGLSELAQRYGLVVVAGMNEALPSDPERFANTQIAVGPSGEILAEYRKLHLYDAFGVTESAVVRPGDVAAPHTFTVPHADPAAPADANSLTFGLQTCYDLRFPEVTRRIVDAGAEVVLVGAQWVPGPLKEYHWSTLVRARAIENTIYVAAAGQNAPTGSGTSMIVDPMGVVVAELGERTAVAAAELSIERVTEVRTRNPAVSLRRFSVTP
ncbi:carbon-nitrogen hydrolase family protein [Lipingzhangella sp. LS1_29]|uniref:Carbon-nitrogen hydrolase family protein n=1 Tax=Lipingzhangella rawalii TaxID=2055835 RepID=A0ABU2H7M2_9ACTN|nr:carbon-nitrogen hydrolase family protein [Lipingzhangella rawalii]MDS1270604.1 carbon-nitrogen hydrolase family protein [Lipingzhangella rawalii]